MNKIGVEKIVAGLEMKTDKVLDFYLSSGCSYCKVPVDKITLHDWTLSFHGVAMYSMNTVFIAYENIESIQVETVKPPQSSQPQAKAKDPAIKVYVNGENHLFFKKTVSFRELVDLEYPNKIGEEDSKFAIHYRPGRGRNETMTFGEKCVLDIQEGMIFTVVYKPAEKAC